MCGIAGILDPRPGRDYARALQAMTDAQAHRGPDDQGHWHDETAWLGHRRLSILDLSPAGHQPMTSEDGSLWVVYNGEIYNYVELAAELKTLGHVFRSSCDTEVILHAYEQWGEWCVERFNGMWAFALWDTRRQRLFASRDRFGIKPFVYTVQGEALLFASEVKGLLASGLVRAAPDLPALTSYLLDGYLDAGERTCFDGIRNLPPGHSLTWENGRLGLSPYWPDPSFWVGLDQPLQLEPAELRHLLRDAVRLRLRSDVPVGTCLSGGLDSSSILALAHQLTEHQATSFNYWSFTAVFPGFELDESDYVAAMVERYRCQAHRVEMSAEEVQRDLAALTWTQEIPLYTGSLYAQYRVMKHAHEQGIKVLLDGQGGDEVLAGYPLYFPAAAGDALAGGRPRLAWQTLAAMTAYHRFSWFQALGYGALNLLPVSAQGALRQRFGRPLITLGRDAAGAYPGKPYDCRAPFPSRLARVQWHMLRHWLLPALLHFEDRSSMAFAIETRLPFLDFRLVEAGLRLAGSLKVNDQQGKWLLRQAVRGLVPDTVIDRRDKIGFAAPDRQWCQGPLGGQLRDLAFGDSFRERGWCDPNWLAGLAANPDRVDHRLLWRLASTELWARTCLDNRGPVPAAQSASTP